MQQILLIVGDRYPDTGQLIRTILHENFKHVTTAASDDSAVAFVKSAGYWMNQCNVREGLVDEKVVDLTFWLLPIFFVQIEGCLEARWNDLDRDRVEQDALFGVIKTDGFELFLCFGHLGEERLELLVDIDASCFCAIFLGHFLLPSGLLADAMHLGAVQHFDSLCKRRLDLFEGRSQVLLDELGLRDAFSWSWNWFRVSHFFYCNKLVVVLARLVKLFI